VHRRLDLSGSVSRPADSSASTTQTNVIVDRVAENIVQTAFVRIYRKIKIIKFTSSLDHPNE
jgi:hypothetical protein